MKCKHCHGTGVICNRIGDVTNHNWIKEFDINDHAKWLSTITYACMRCGLNNGKGYCPFGKCIIEKEDALMWLQEERHGNNSV